MKKKLASILLCLCMVLTLLPTAALADAPASTGGVTYKNGETTLSGDPFNTTPDADGKITLPGKDSVTKEGYTFVGWSDGTKGYLPGAEYTVPAGGKTLTALWTAKNDKPTAYVKIGGKTLNDSKTYYHNAAGGTEAANTTATGANAMFVDGVLVLSGLDVKSESSGTYGIYWSYYAEGSGYQPDSKYDLVIYLLPGTENTVKRKNDSAINGASGYSNGPSLSIRGSGKLTADGKSYGIWIWQDITIESSVTLDAKGGDATSAKPNPAGIANNTSNGTITVKSGATVKATSGKYGVLSDNGSYGHGNLKVESSATFTASGGTQALKDFSQYTITPTLYAGASESTATELTSNTKANLDGTTKTPPKYISTSHTHNWTYDTSTVVENNYIRTITATCNVAGCTYTGDNAVTITLTAPGADTPDYEGKVTYNGSAKEATVTCTPAGVLTPPTIEYRKEVSSNHYESITPDTARPTDPGKYKASITLGPLNHEVTVEVTYEIVVPYGISLKKDGNPLTSYTFPAATEGYTTQPSLSVTVKNTGTQTTGNLIVTITGDNAAAFSHGLAGGGLGSIGSGSSSVIDLTVKPVLGLTAGTYTATVSVGNDNVPAQTFTVSFAVTAGSSTGGGSDTGGGSSTSDPAAVTIVNSNGTAVTAPKVGDTLRANVTGATVTRAYQWYHDNSGSLSAIDGATGATYTLTAADVGKNICVIVSNSETGDELCRATLENVVAADSSTPSGGSGTSGGGSSSGGSSSSGSSSGGSSSGGSSSGSSSSGSSYHVTLPTTGNGNVTSDRPTARKGDTVTITLTPDAGYRVDGVVVKDQNGKQLTVKRNADGTYSFTMPAGKVTVEPVFVWQNPFVDVSESNYYASAVEWALKNGVTGGTDATHFSPDAACTRGQLVTFLYRWAVANGVDVSVGENTNILSFNDAFSIPEYAVAAFQWAVGAGIVQGNGGNLMPNQTCTRAQAVAFLFRFAASQGMDAETLQKLVSGFGDAAQVPGYALSAFNWALANSIVQGDHGNLMPNNDCTRAHIVTFLYRFLGE